MVKRTFGDRGLPYASELALQNCKDLLAILRWNEANGIKFFRLSSDLFPWSSEYNLSDLPDYQQISHHLATAGQYAKANGHRITTHPGPFNVLGSPKESVVVKTIKELNTHSEVFDLMGLPDTPYAKINIHVGGTYGGDFSGTASRWCDNFFKLSAGCQNRLTVENDDKSSMWSTRHLYDYIYKVIRIPIVFDYHHHKFCTGGQTEREALELAMSTWQDVKPVVHYSQDRSVEHNDPKIRPQAHSDSYWTAIDTYGHDIDVMLECKHKEQGLFAMRQLLLEKDSLAA
jgi:UV DNA damage endonuclease